MSLPRFFLSQQDLSCEQESPFDLLLDAEDVKHARVLRLAPGEHIAVIDGTGTYYECEIHSLDNHGMSVSITQHGQLREAGPSVTLVQGLAKGDKMDDIVRHATELGVQGFIPLSAQRSVVKLTADKSTKRLARWQSIAKSAAMQSGQMRVPEVHEVVSVAELACMLDSFDIVLVCWEEASAQDTISVALEAYQQESNTGAIPHSVAVVIGPEGGLAPEEVDIITSSHPHCYPITLGPSILRTETAGIVAPALVLYELGGMGRKREEACE